MLPRMPVRVLLAEGDDSTRHVISALLRKCGYRVAAASDGVKAWNILKEKSFHIDLVLTEVELPLMSGFLLLSTIMEHDAAKNIPVIMMSSHDSVSMVFKCMLKGAADFLVKPLRKNELRNLWQHIAVTKADNLNKDGPSKNRECSEQESDAQVSFKTISQFGPFGHGKMKCICQIIRQFTNSPACDVAAANNLIPTREDDLSPKKKTCLNNSDKASRDIELVHIIDNQQKHNMQMVVDTVTTSIGNDEKGSIPAHQLELSLRRTDYGKLESEEKNDRRMLNHSTSSAFSLYNCRTASALGNAGDGQLCSTSETQADMENKNGDSAAPTHDTTGTNRAPIRVVPFPVPQKSQQTEPNEMGPKAVENTEEQSVIISRPNSSGKQLRVEIPRDEARHVSPMTGESGTSTVLDSARNNLSGSGSGCDSNSNRITAPTESSNTFNGVPETRNTEGSRHLSQREAALNKFRLKRKDRCFEKKVRYQSRKLLAEQRPRVKGQFVRQDHSIQGS
ncbi:hypothetical protein HU200_066323 [Digitaria exilis]|uniref:Pseudo-response regulator n=1 Tax=Digitaria exilis TaxID=1010633 RepID=A0A834ZYE1_9POAL|nr:hypothetical protein HU200_066323 [Digitaria exilis]